MSQSLKPSIPILSKEELVILSESTLLLVEDDKTISNAMSSIFSKIFKKVLLAYDGEEAKRIFLHNQLDIDVVLTDLKMPYVNGDELIRYIRQDLKNRTIPIIILTASQNFDNMMNLLKLQINDFICKPSLMATTLKILTKHIKQAYYDNTITRKFKIYETIIDETNLISETDLEGVITYANKKLSDISGYTNGELIGQTHQLLRHKDNPSRLYKELWLNIKAGNNWVGKIKNKKKDGSYYWAKTYICPIYNKINEISGYVATGHIITEELDLQKDLQTYIKNIKIEHGKKSLSVKEELCVQFMQKNQENNSKVKNLENLVNILEHDKQGLKAKKAQSVLQINHLEKLVKSADDTKDKALLTAKEKIKYEYELRLKAEKKFSAEKEKHLSTNIKLNNLEIENITLRDADEQKTKRINELINTI